MLSSYIIIVILKQLNIKKIKSIKIILEKIIKKQKQKKIMSRNTIVIHNVLKKITNLNSQPTLY
jgi:hypothetical protein